MLLTVTLLSQNRQRLSFCVMQYIFIFCANGLFRKILLWDITFGFKWLTAAQSSYTYTLMHSADKHTTAIYLQVSFFSPVPHNSLNISHSNEDKRMKL